jgi:hypothetical protein
MVVVRIALCKGIMFKVKYKNGQGIIDSIGNKKMTEKCYVYKLLNWIKVDDNDCWLFQGKLRANGYGVIKFEGRERSAHHVYFLVFKGPIKEGLLACHKCDVRNCVNPSHIFWGTHDDNQKDMKVKGRSAKGVRNGMNKLSENQVKDILSLKNKSVTQREIAKKFNVTQAMVSRIWLKKAWTYLGEL